MATFDYRPEDGPDPGVGDRAAVVSGLAAAYAVTAERQADAAKFLAAHGAEVLPGHPDVGRVRGPDVGADPDAYPDAADS